jgi:hypothetical protein
MMARTTTMTMMIQTQVMAFPFVGELPTVLRTIA